MSRGNIPTFDGGVSVPDGTIRTPTPPTSGVGEGLQQIGTQVSRIGIMLKDQKVAEQYAALDSEAIEGLTNLEIEVMETGEYEKASENFRKGWVKRIQGIENPEVRSRMERTFNQRYFSKVPQLIRIASNRATQRTENQTQELSGLAQGRILKGGDVDSEIESFTEHVAGFRGNGLSDERADEIIQNFKGLAATARLEHLQATNPLMAREFLDSDLVRENLSPGQIGQQRRITENAVSRMRVDATEDLIEKEQNLLATRVDNMDLSGDDWFSFSEVVQEIREVSGDRLSLYEIEARILEPQIRALSAKMPETNDPKELEQINKQYEYVKSLLDKSNHSIDEVLVDADNRRARLNASLKSEMSASDVLNSYIYSGGQTVPEGQTLDMSEAVRNRSFEQFAQLGLSDAFSMFVDAGVPLPSKAAEMLREVTDPNNPNWNFDQAIASLSAAASGSIDEAMAIAEAQHIPDFWKAAVEFEAAGDAAMSEMLSQVPRNKLRDHVKQIGPSISDPNKWVNGDSEDDSGVTRLDDLLEDQFGDGMSSYPGTEGRRAIEAYYTAHFLAAMNQPGDANPKSIWNSASANAVESMGKHYQAPVIMTPDGDTERVLVRRTSLSDSQLQTFMTRSRFFANELTGIQRPGLWDRAMRAMALTRGISLPLVGDFGESYVQSGRIREKNGTVYAPVTNRLGVPEGFVGTDGSGTLLTIPRAHEDYDEVAKLFRSTPLAEDKFHDLRKQLRSTGKTYDQWIAGMSKNTVAKWDARIYNEARRRWQLRNGAAFPDKSPSDFDQMIQEVTAELENR